MQDGFYYFGELKIPKQTNIEITVEFVNNLPQGFVGFWKCTFPNDNYNRLELWKIVGNWLSSEAADYLSLWQIEDICREKNLIYKPYNRN